MTNQYFKSNHPGFTLIEIIVVIAIIAILALTFFTTSAIQRRKAEDGKTKSDLENLKIAFENYYNDHNCYPPATWFDSPDDCGSAQLSPYLSRIPCDQNTGKPYLLETDSTTCEWFKFYATFSLPQFDRQAIAQRSHTGSPKGNYGVSSSNVTVSVYYDPTLASPSPTPTLPTSRSPSPDTYFCLSAGPGNGVHGNCNAITGGQTCSPSYTDPNCGLDHCATTTSTCH